MRLFSVSDQNYPLRRFQFLKFGVITFIKGYTMALKLKKFNPIYIAHPDFMGVMSDFKSRGMWLTIFPLLLLRWFPKIPIPFLLLWVLGQLFFKF